MQTLVLAALRLVGASRSTGADAARRSRPRNADDPKTMSGMSILGNQEAPKSLVIVPWKSSEIGNGIGCRGRSTTRIRAVDKDVFMRELELLRDQVERRPFM